MNSDFLTAELHYFKISPPPPFNRKADELVGLARTKLKDGRCCWTEQRAERAHSRLSHARREAARTGHEPNRRGACVGLAERNERSQPHARASAVFLSLGVTGAFCERF